MSSTHSKQKELASKSIAIDRSQPDAKQLVEVGPPVSNNRENDAQNLPPDYRRITFCDPVAFQYLVEDEARVAADQWTELKGYELYIVEQWVCSRTHPTFVICTYTGDAAHSILVNTLAVPRDEKQWSPRLKVYFQAVSKFHAREQETHLGSLMVTNLSAFPSTLTVIPVPDGDVRKHKLNFMVNENLKRMGCAGRAAITLQEPPTSTVAKYHHLYQTSEAVPLQTSVVEVVKLCQTALVLYGKLDPIFVDGLLCDMTEQAISDWWNDIGTEFYNIEPNDGIFGPTTVAALLGLWIGTYNRLKATGSAMGKDVLDLYSLKRAIGHFQKTSKISKTRRLDRETLDRLHRTTAKNASGEGWAVQRAVKSTVAELSGKGGEMVMGMVGAKEKAGISDIETLDIERFAQLVPGDRLKWLWQGKRSKTVGDDLGWHARNDVHGKAYKTGEDGVFRWTSTNKGDRFRDEDHDTTNSQSAGEGKLRRLRGTVPGLRSHGHRSHKHDHETTDTEDEARVTRHPAADKDDLRDHMLRSPTTHKSQTSSDRQVIAEPVLNLALAVDNNAPHTPPQPHLRLQPVKRRTNSTELSHRQQLRGLNRVVSESPGKKRIRKELASVRRAINDDKYQKFATEFDDQGPQAPTLRRSRSSQQAREFDVYDMRFLSLPRRLSFSVIDDSLYGKQGTLQPLKSHSRNADDLPPSLSLTAKQAEQTELAELTARLLRLEQCLLPRTMEQVERTLVLDLNSRQSLTDLNDAYYSSLEEYQHMQSLSEDVIAREKALLHDDFRRIEGLGAKLDYELDALALRMQEVEDGAAEFEKNVVEIEDRVAELVRERPHQNSDRSWLQRFSMLLRISSAQVQAVQQ